MAMEIASAVTGAVVAEGVKESGKTALRQLVVYCFCFNSLVEELGNEKKKLTDRKEIVEGDVERAKENTEDIVSVVENWLAKARDLMENADSLKEQAKQACCLEGCPTWIWRYRLGKKISKLIGNIKEQISSGTELGPVGRIKPLEGMRHHQNQNFVLFNCTNSAYDGLLKALEEDKHKIGLWGIGGSGKTTLVKKLGADVQGKKLFDKVVFVVVSSNVDVKKIQGEIAEQLDLEMKEQYEWARAQRLSMRLKQGQKILIILDDLWKRIDLQNIGIPEGKDCNSCKVLLTSRRQEVCTFMNCQVIVRLGLLDEEEAWRLFQIYAGLSEDTTDAWKSDLGKKISKECGGLPVAIVALSRSLKGKQKVIWYNSLSALENYEQVDIPESFQESEDPYKCLKMSYDNLEDEKARSLFLLCSLFPEDSKIVYEDLRRLAFGLDAFENVKSCERMRSMVDATIEKLIDFCLLLNVEDGQSVKMHDWVRDVALSIAQKQIQSVMKPDDLKALVGDTDANATVTKLYCGDISEFPDQLACPNLEILYVSLRQAKLPDAFFGRVKGVKVLTLDSFGLQLGQSIQELTNLRSLRLNGCKMKDLCFLRQMNKLILLDVYNCEIGGNPFEVLGSCSQLQELYFVGNHILEEDKRKDKEVVGWFHGVVWSPRLQRYHLDTGCRYGWPTFDDIRLRSRIVSIAGFDSSTTITRVKDLIERAELLIFEGIEDGCKNVIPDMQVALNELSESQIRHSERIECLIDNITHSGQVGNAAFSKLVKPQIDHMDSMKALCHGPPPHGQFEKLEFLVISKCSKWRFLFTDAVAKSLIMLSELRIEYCNALECLIGDENEEEIISADGRPVFPKLKSLWVNNSHKLKCLIPVSYAEGFQQLEDLSIAWIHNLTYIFGESNQNQNEFHIINLPVLKRLMLLRLPSIRGICPPNYCPKWPLLDQLYLYRCRNFMPTDILVADTLRSQTNVTTVLKIEGCGKLNAVFSSSSLGSLQQLKELWIMNCESLEHIIEEDGENQNLSDSHSKQVRFPQLTTLVVLGCHKLKGLFTISGAHCKMDLQNLLKLEIEGCGQLNAVFSASSLGSLQQLKELWIMNCESLEHIIEEDGENQNLSDSHSKQVRFPQLTTLVVQGCHKLKAVFTISTSQELPKLRNLVIVEATGLDEIFKRQQGDTEDRVGDLLPELKIVILAQLESLTHVCRGFQLQSVRDWFVDHCSNLSFTPRATQTSLLNLVFEVCRGRGVPRRLFDFIKGIEREAASNEDSETRERIHEDTEEDEDPEIKLDKDVSSAQFSTTQ